MEKDPSLFPESDLSTLSGEALDDLISKKNKYMLIVFYKQSCQTSLYLLEHLARFQKHSKIDSHLIVLISQDDLEETNRFIEMQQLSFPVALDFPEYKLSRRLNFMAVPACYLVKNTGKIEMESIGFVRDEIAEMIDRLLRVNGCEPHPLFEEPGKIPAIKPG